MSKLRFARGLLAFLLSAVGVLGLVGASRAAVFVGSFDPAFGTSLPNLGFRGAGTFFIPDACLLLPDGFVPNSHPCSGNTMSMLSTTVELYNSSLGDAAPTLDTAVFGPVSLIDVLIGSNQLTGVNTPMVGPQIVNVMDGLTILYSGPLWLQFEQLDEFSFNFAFVFACERVAPGCDPTLQSNGAIVEFTRVAEPATLALVLAAFGVVGVASRRRRPRPSR